MLRILKEGGTKPTANNTFARNLVVYGLTRGMAKAWAQAASDRTRKTASRGTRTAGPSGNQVQGLEPQADHTRRQRMKELLLLLAR